MKINHKHFVYTISLPELAWKSVFILVVNSGPCYILYFAYLDYC